jgi:DNA-binding NarL/FixJ family response regulator
MTVSYVVASTGSVQFYCDLRIFMNTGRWQTDHEFRIFNGMSAVPVTVVIVEDDDKIRSLLRSVIDEDPGCACTYTYSDGHKAIAEFRQSLPDVILMDVEMPAMSGIECVREIRTFAPNVPVLMLTVHDDDETLFSALCVGASGYLVKGTPTDGIIDAIHDAHAGGAPMSPGIARKVIGSFRRAIASPLSSREQEVLELLCDGDSYKDVAAKLYLSKHTVRRHIRSIYEKLEVSSRAEMVSKAHKDGLVN